MPCMLTLHLRRRAHPLPALRQRYLAFKALSIILRSDLHTVWGMLDVRFWPRVCKNSKASSDD
ncbi:hypothetical protein EMIT0P12_30241 [Pseudomonas sp. IT-P12]